MIWIILITLHQKRFDKVLIFEKSAYCMEKVQSTKSFRLTIVLYTYPFLSIQHCLYRHRAMLAAAGASFYSASHSGQTISTPDFYFHIYGIKLKNRNIKRKHLQLFSLNHCPFNYFSFVLLLHFLINSPTWCKTLLNQPINIFHFYQCASHCI